MVTKAQLKKLNVLMQKASEAASRHAEASRAALEQFEKMFGDLPEEAGFLQASKPKERAAYIFNEVTSHGENPSDVPWHLLAEHLDELMNEGEG